MSMIWSLARGLTSRYLSQSSDDEACDSRASALAGVRLPFEIVRSVSDEAPATVSDVARGNDILDLHFHQVLGDGPVLLDIRRIAFTRRQSEHPGLLTLGLGLVSLYEHLESVSVELDGAASFDHVRRGRHAAAS